MKTYKLWAEIDLDALRHNYRTIRDTVQKSAPDCRVIAVVKADAYGHGVGAVSRTLLSEGCDFFAVSSVAEALELKAIVGDGAQILILGYSMPEDLQTILENNVIQTVFSDEYREALSAEMARLKNEKRISDTAKLRVHLKLDTGMNRLGFSTADAAEAADALRKSIHDPHLKAEGMFTHFASADTDGGSGMAAVQLARFDAVADALRETNDCPSFLHTANSAAALSFPDSYKSAVRAGIILYGLSPDGEINPAFRPVMTLKARIAHIHTLKAGESVSYGATYTALRDQRIATVPVGYGDGFLRRFEKASFRLADGTLAPIVGRICMDQCMIDVGASDVHPGDAVTVFGGDDGTMIKHLAELGGTIHYEITSILTPRVARVTVG